MMIELAQQMNFNLQFVFSEDSYGNYDHNDNKWNGILGKLESREIDIAVSEITMTKERMDAFDFACPLILSRAKLFIKEPGSADVQWNAYLRVRYYFNLIYFGYIQDLFYINLYSLI